MYQDYRSVLDHGIAGNLTHPATLSQLLVWLLSSVDPALHAQLSAWLIMLGAGGCSSMGLNTVR